MIILLRQNVNPNIENLFEQIIKNGQFSQVIVLPQGKFEKLLTSNSDEKEKILTSIFGEDKWQEIAEQLYQEVVDRKDALKGKKDRISHCYVYCSSKERYQNRSFIYR